MVAWPIRVVKRGVPAWYACMAAWLRGCMAHERGRLRGQGLNFREKNNFISVFYGQLR